MQISPDTLKAVLTFIVSAGSSALVTQLVRGWMSLRTGARASNREVIKDLAAARDDAEDRAAKWLRDKDYWRSVAGDYSFQLRNHGLVPQPPQPVSPSELAKEVHDSPRRRRAARAPTTAEIQRDPDGTP